MLTEHLAFLVFLVFIPSFFVSDEIMYGTQMAKEFGLSITLAIVLPIALVLWTIYNWKDLSIGITKIDILVVIFAAYCGFLIWYHGYSDRVEITAVQDKLFIKKILRFQPLIAHYFLLPKTIPPLILKRVLSDLIYLLLHVYKTARLTIPSVQFLRIGLAV